MLRGRFSIISHNLIDDFDLEFSEAILLSHLEKLTVYGTRSYRTFEETPRGEKSIIKFLDQIARLIKRDFRYKSVKQMFIRLEAKNLLVVDSDSLGVNLTKKYLEKLAEYQTESFEPKPAKTKQEDKKEASEIFTSEQFKKIVLSENQNLDASHYQNAIFQHYTGKYFTSNQFEVKIKTWLKRDLQQNKAIFKAENTDKKQPQKVMPAENKPYEFFDFYVNALNNPKEDTTLEDYKTFANNVLYIAKKISLDTKAKKIVKRVTEMLSNDDATKKRYENAMKKYNNTQ